MHLLYYYILFSIFYRLYVYKNDSHLLEFYFHAFSSSHKKSQWPLSTIFICIFMDPQMKNIFSVDLYQKVWLPLLYTVSYILFLFDIIPPKLTRAQSFKSIIFSLTYSPRIKSTQNKLKYFKSSMSNALPSLFFYGSQPPESSVIK